MPGGLGLSDSRQPALSARLTQWAERFGPCLVLGLSGGGDSMALAVGCAHWMQSGKGVVHAVCVDHGLRESAREEAQQTVAWAQALGLTAECVSLDLGNLPTKLQERARQGRHQALGTVAQAQGARVILLAHNLDDQHETVALRLASKTGIDGLAGMSSLAPSPFYRDDWPCLVGRPLLDMSRTDLRHDLMAVGQSWHEDPSNTNMAFGRIRARSRLAALKFAGADGEALGRIGAYAATLRTLSDQATRAFLRRCDLHAEADHFTLLVDGLEKTQPCIGERAIGWLALAASDHDRLPEAQKSTRLYQAICQTDFQGATLAGVKFSRRGSTLIVTPAPRRRDQASVDRLANRDIHRRLLAVSGDLDQFVTHLA